MSRLSPQSAPAPDTTDGLASSAPQVDPQLAATTVQTVPTTLSEEEFLGRVEMAVDGGGGSALRPLHDLTPLVWEVAAP